MNTDIYGLIEKIIDNKVKGADTYINKGSRWLIFTDKKKWIFELTKEGTLWYNYYFFEKIFKLISLEVVENQHHITKWAENFIQNGVKHTDGCQIGTSTSIEDAIQNGVKETWHGIREAVREVENTIQNGVKETKHNTFEDGLAMEEAIQNGVKNTQAGNGFIDFEVEDTIQNGVKNTKGYRFTSKPIVGDIIENGVKEIKEVSDSSLSSEIFKVRCKQTIRDGVKRTELGGKDRKIDEIKDIVENGIKETKHCSVSNDENARMTLKNGIKVTKTPNHNNVVDALDFLKYNGTDSHRELIDGVIQNGIKEVKELPDKSGELRGYGDYYNRQEDRTKPHTQYVNDVVLNGIKETKYCELHSLMRADHIIRDGVKETNWRKVDNFPEFEERVIENGIKETWGYEKQPQIRVNEVINKGEKH